MGKESFIFDLDGTAVDSPVQKLPSDMLMMDSDENSVFQEIMERINSQFEYEWRFGKTQSDLIKSDRSNAHSAD